VITLDLMRGFAALAVLFAHLRGDTFVEFGALPASQHGVLAALFFAATRLGHEAVLVFFVLSGFLVGGQVLARLRDGRFKLYDYALDRTTRIFIPLIPACLLTGAIETFLFRQPPPFGQLIANMVGLNELVTDSLAINAVLWSLTYEIWFYILAGVLAHAISTRLNAMTALILAACCLVFSILQTRYLVFWMLGAFTSAYLDIRFKGLLALIGLCLGLIGSGFYELAADSRSINAIAYIPPIVADYMMCIGVLLALPFLTKKTVNQSLSRIRPLAAALAGFSYTLYLTHRPTDAALGFLFDKAESLSVHSFAVYVCRILICLAVAIGFYFVFERNTAAVRRLIRKYSTPLQETEGLA